MAYFRMLVLNFYGNPCIHLYLNPVFFLAFKTAGMWKVDMTVIHMPFESVKSVVLMYCMLLVKECTIYRLHA